VLLSAAPGWAACRPEVRAEVPVRLQDGFALVRAEVGGRAVTLLLDTGAQGMLLLPETAARLGLRAVPGQTTRLLGTGGVREAPNVWLRELTLGGMPLPGGSVPVVALPGVPLTDPPLAGLLGAPLLAAYDVDLDLQAGRLMLLAPTGCAPPGQAVGLQLMPDGDVSVPVQVNGAPLLAIADTGTRATLIADTAARRLGLDGPVAASTARGIDGQRMQLRPVRLREFRVGGDVSLNVPVAATALQIEPAEMLLGLDFFLRRRVWISYAARVMVVRPSVPSPAGLGPRSGPRPG